jgi:hypothetical protein
VLFLFASETNGKPCDGISDETDALPGEKREILTPETALENALETTRSGRTPRERQTSHGPTPENGGSTHREDSEAHAFDTAKNGATAQTPETSSKAGTPSPVFRGHSVETKPCRCGGPAPPRAESARRHALQGSVSTNTRPTEPKTSSRTPNAASGHCKKTTPSLLPRLLALKLPMRDQKPHPPAPRTRRLLHPQFELVKLPRIPKIPKTPHNTPFAE